MTRRPFPDIESPRVLSDRRRPDPWPWIGLVLSVGVIAWVITQASPALPSDGGGTVSQVVAAPGVLTVVVYLPEHPTQTPDVRIVTATPTVTPTEAAICGQERMGDPCLLFPPPMTPTPTATVRPCDRVTPSASGYGTLCQPVIVSAARQETE